MPRRFHVHVPGVIVVGLLAVIAAVAMLTVGGIVGWSATGICFGATRLIPR